VLLTYFDFSRKVVGFGPLLTTSGAVERDLTLVENFFRPIHGKYRKAWQQAA
jgi:hypothetical protein